MRERRSKDQIVVEILHLCEDGENITRIVYRTNTSFAIVKAYLHILMKNNLLEFIEASPGSTRQRERAWRCETGWRASIS